MQFSPERIDMLEMLRHRKGSLHLQRKMGLTCASLPAIWLN